MIGPGILDGSQHALAELRVQFADGAGQRRNDGCFVQRILRAVHEGLGHVDLVVGAVELGLGHVAGGFEPDKVRIRKQLAVEQFQVAVEIRLGLFQVRLRRGFGGERGFVTGLGLVDCGDVNVRVDLHEQITLLDRLAFLDRQINDFAADFRADGDLHDGLDFAVGHDGVGETVERDLLGLDDDDRVVFPEDRRQHQPDERQPDDRENDEPPAFFWFGHGLFGIKTPPG